MAAATGKKPRWQLPYGAAILPPAAPRRALSKPFNESTEMMRATTLCGLAILFVVSSLSLAAEPKAGADAILGKWFFPKKDGQLEIVRDGDTWVGTVIEYKDPDAKDKHNPDEAMRERPFIGITMLKDFKYDAEKKEWSEGTIYDGESGKTYKCRMWFENNDLNQLNVRGFIGFSFLGRTEIFERVTPESEARVKAEAEKKPEAKDGE
jgi:uncharacterized protein (DUF2147 family)